MSIELLTNAQVIAALNEYDAELFFWQNKRDNSKGNTWVFADKKVSIYQLKYDATKKEAKKRGLTVEAEKRNTD